MKSRKEKNGLASRKTLPTIVAVLAILGICLAGLVFVEDDDSKSATFTTDVFKYQVSSEKDREVEITLYKGKSPTVEIPSSVEREGKTYTVTSIGKDVFYDNKTISSVVIHEGVTEIGSNSFYGCSVKSIELPESLKTIGESAFECSGLESVTIPDGVEIKKMAFYSCSLKELTIPISVDASATHSFFESLPGLPFVSFEFKSYVFEDCKNLEKVTLTPGSGSWHDYKKEMEHSPWNINSSSVKTVIVSDGITTIPEKCFESLKNLKNVTLSQDVSDIKEKAFKDCDSLETIEIPSKVTKVEKNVFEGCEKLNKVFLNQNMISIENYAFKNCKALLGVASQGSNSSIVLPDSLKKIGLGAFQGCTSMELVMLPDTLEKVDYFAFKGCINITKVFVPISLDTANVYKELVNVDAGKYKTHPIFDGCNKIETLCLTPGTGKWFEYGDQLQYTPWQMNKNSITKVLVADGVPSLQAGVFEGLTKLKKVMLPISIDSVVDDNSPAFAGCKNIEDMTFTKGTGEPFAYTSYENTPWKISKNVNTVSFGTGVKYVPAGMFEGSPKLKEIFFPYDIEEIQANAFKSCTSLENISTSASVIGEGAFYGCTELKEVHIYDVTTIEGNAFGKCSNINIIRFGGGLEYVDDHAFEDITFHDGRTGIPATAENLKGCTFTGNASKMVKQV